MFDQKSSENTNCLSKSNLDESRQRNYSIARIRLDDNLQWRCSVCQSVVPTHETHLHLNTCLDKNSPKEPNSPLSVLSDHQFLKELISFAISPMDERPRTKRIERPTPNVKHPVIISKKSKELDSEIKKCIEGIDKCQTTTSMNVSRKPSKLKTCMHSSDLLFQTCDSNVLNDKLNCRQFFTTNKLLINKRNKSENKFQSLPKQTPKEATNGAQVITTVPNKSEQKASQTMTKSKSKSEPKIDGKDLNSSESTQQKQIKTDDKREEKKKSRNESAGKEGSDANGWDHFNAQLIPCSHCFRTFFPHRLSVHEKSCRGIGVGVKKMAKPKPESKVNVRTNLPMKSMFLECTTCGRKYSTTSLTLHELKCRTNNSNRRLSTGKGENVNELSTAWEHFKTQLVSCNKCNRKFLSDRLEKHEPNCKASPVYSTKTNDN